MAQRIAQLRGDGQPLRKQYVVPTHGFHPCPQAAAVPGTGVGKHQPLTEGAWQTFITKEECGRMDLFSR